MTTKPRTAKGNKTTAGRAGASTRKPPTQTVQRKPAKSTATPPPTEPLAIGAADVWAHYFPPKRSRFTVIRTEAEVIWNHFTQKDAAIFTFVGVLTLLSIGII